MGSQPHAVLPPFVAQYVLSQAGMTPASVRADALRLQGQGRADLAAQLEFGARQLRMAAGVYEDEHDEARAALAGATFAVESGSAKTDNPVRESTPGTEIATKEAAEMLGVSAQRVGQLVKVGALSGRKVGSAWLVDRASVELAVQARRAS